MRHAAILVALLVLAGGCSHGERETRPTQPTVPSDVLTAARGTVEQWRQAYQTHTFEALAPLYAHETTLVLVQDGLQLVGWASVESMIKDRLTRNKKIVVRLRDIQVISLGTTGATATAAMTRELGDDVTTTTETGVLTLVLRKDADGWRIVTEHYSYRRGGA